MRVLIVDGYHPASRDREIVAMTRSELEAHGNEVEVVSVESGACAGYMTADERRAYETDEPLLDVSARNGAELVQAADALVFAYPTTLFGVPPGVKSWLERVMVLGVAFVFDDKRRVRPGLTKVRRLAVVTTTRHSALRTARARDLGRRTIMRTLRLNCHPRCRRTFVRIPQDADRSQARRRIARAFRHW